MPPGVAELLTDGEPRVLTREGPFAGYGLDWDLGPPPGEGRRVPAGPGGV